MTCHRCGGLMLAEQYDALHNYSEQTECTGWRCVNCGTLLDPVIAANRQQSSPRMATQNGRTARHRISRACVSRREEPYRC